MTETPAFSFTTQIVDTIPMNTMRKNKIRTIDPQNHYLKLKQLRNKMRESKQKFHQQTVNHHKVKRSLDEVMKKSMIKRIQFLKIYGNKKSKYQHKELLQLKKRQEEKFQRKSMDLVKRRKLQNQLHHIILQNQQEDHIYHLQSKNRQQKQTFRRQLEIANMKEQSLKHYDEIRKGKTQFLIRKKSIQTSVSMRSKHNYLSKINQQLNMIRQYEDIMGEIEHFSGFSQSKGDSSTLFQTMQHQPQKTFITNNTINIS